MGRARPQCPQELGEGGGEDLKDVQGFSSLGPRPWCRRVTRRGGEREKESEKNWSGGKGTGYEWVGGAPGESGPGLMGRQSAVAPDKSAAGAAGAAAGGGGGGVGGMGRPRGFDPNQTWQRHVHPGGGGGVGEMGRGGRGSRGCRAAWGGQSVGRIRVGPGVLGGCRSLSGRWPAGHGRRRWLAILYRCHLSLRQGDRA